MKIAALVSALALAGVVAVVVTAVVSPGDDAAAEKKGECETDRECGSGRMCADGACIILLSSENADIWREDIARQRDPAAGWSPQVPFGEKLVPARVCPLRAGDVREANEKVVAPQVRISVYEVFGDEVTVYQMIRAKGDMWLESLRFRFPAWMRPEREGMCASEGVDRFREVSGIEGAVDVSLKQAVPVGGQAVAALSATGPLPSAREDETRVLEMPLEAIGLAESARKTVLALPLGSGVASIEGPAPYRQSLLEGRFAYFWEHGAESSSVTVRIKPAARVSGRLDMSSLNP